MPDAATKAKISREDCDSYAQLEEKRLSLGRELRLIEKQQAPLEEKLLAFVRENGGKLKAIKKFDYLLSITMKDGTPRWKDAFIDRLGTQEAAKVAEAAAAQKRESFALTPAT